MTGVLYTFNAENKKNECLMSHGLFGELMKNGKPINSSFFFYFCVNFFLGREIKGKILYQTLNEKNPEKVD